jgi:hypothetical protein
VSYQVLSPKHWAEREFANVQMGDKRLNKRVRAVAEAMASNPSGSIPRQCGDWAGSKGAYRLFCQEQATLKVMCESHWQRTRQACMPGDLAAGCPPVVLLVQDTTWLDYSAQKQTQGLGWFGRSRKVPRGGQGMFLHNVLAVVPTRPGSGQVLGLAWAKTWCRTGEPMNGDEQRRSIRRRSEDRESLRWSEAVDEIGAPPPGPVRWLHVGDRESDIFELYRRTRQLPGVGFVIRVAKDRNAALGHDTPDQVARSERKFSRLKELARSMPALGQTTLWIAPKAGRAGRWAKLKVSGGAVTLWSPQLHYMGEAFRCWALRVWEVDAPEGVEPLEWILLSSEPVNDLADALRISEYYSLRWLVEEYHQCLKTGCKVEQRQLMTAERLEALIGILGIVAVRLLQLKTNARLTPETPASQCVPHEWVTTLSKRIGKGASSMTVRQFTHEMAKMGGFLGRKGDGEPGWRTLWRGWEKLSLIHEGYELATTGKRCG